jgi:hypothetical protein
MTNDDERQAAALRVGISNSLGAGTLAVLAGLVALFTYYQLNFKPMILFYIFMLLAVIAIVVSLICAGRGSAEVVKKLAESKYDEKTKVPQFNVQAITALAGVILAILATVSGSFSDARPSRSPA